MKYYLIACHFNGYMQYVNISSLKLNFLKFGSELSLLSRQKIFSKLASFRHDRAEFIPLETFDWSRQVCHWMFIPTTSLFIYLDRISINDQKDLNH